MANDNLLRKRLLKLNCAALCDASPLVRVITDLIPIHSDAERMVGIAHPISCFNDYLSIIKGIADAQKGDVLVVDGEGQEQAVFGELLAAEAFRRGISGIIVDGAIRDIAGILQIGMPVYYRSSNPRAGRAEVIEVPTDIVSINGVIVTLGDWIVGDADGVIAIPSDQAAEIIEVAEEIQSIEAKVFKSVKKGESLLEIIRFEGFRREHEHEIRSRLEYHLTNTEKNKK